MNRSISLQTHLSLSMHDGHIPFQSRLQHNRSSFTSGFCMDCYVRRTNLHTNVSIACDLSTAMVFRLSAQYGPAQSSPAASSPVFRLTIQPAIATVSTNRNKGIQIEIHGSADGSMLINYTIVLRAIPTWNPLFTIRTPSSSFTSNTHECHWKEQISVK